ncbi:hypothetical protein [Pseudomonas sp. Irchel s3a10]|jgi:hypothetical protein|uniref:hypothetical protein n=1 Tax=Pseudomonas sp. Irchel s3a10 TaxID=2009045 RepID=UPI000BA3899B|nr:hypothetical protein [Pseudomonas sp. Irchel s3a10]
MVKLNKRIYYFRSMAAGKELLDFSDDLAEVSDLKTIGESEISIMDDIVRIQRFKDLPDGRLYHFTMYSPGSKTATLTPKAATKKDEEVGAKPPAGREFKSGECYLYVCGHNVLFCAHGLTPSRAVQYIFMLLKSNGYDTESFKFSPIGNIDKLKLLNEQGVKSIRLNVSAYKLSLPKKKGSWLAKALAPVGNELSALVSKDVNRSEEKALEDLMVSIEIGLEGNSRATDESKETVVDLASEILEDDDGYDLDSFTIMTRENTPITGGDVKLHTTVRPEKDGSSLNYVNIWDAMGVYYTQLKRQKLLEQ